MKTVILCGGKGIRLREKTVSIPKPLLRIGSRPILWHVMKIFASQGFNDFILCLGYKGKLVKKYFSGLLNNPEYKDWRINFASTGLDTQTGGRLKQVEDLIGSEPFMFTYADGLADINLKSLLKYHNQHKKIGTVTCVHPSSYFGELRLSGKGSVLRFDEKPQLERWVSGGFFVFEKKFFKLLKSDSILEKEPLARLAKRGQLTAYKQSKFWKCMDTYKDMYELNQLWIKGGAPWKIW